MHERPQGAKRGGFVQIRIIQNNSRRLATQLKKHRFDVFTSGRRNDGTDMRATGEVDLAHGWVCDKSIGHVRCVRCPVIDDVQTPGGETSVPIDVAKSPEAFRGQFGSFKDCGVSCCQGECDGASSKDVWGVPGEKVQCQLESGT